MSWLLYPRRNGGFIMLNNRAKRAVISCDGDKNEFYEYEKLPKFLADLEDGYPVDRDTAKRVLKDGFSEWTKR